jgi:hypothetical protein
VLQQRRLVQPRSALLVPHLRSASRGLTAVEAHSGGTAIASKGFDFGGALAFLREGHRVRRAGWNGKGMHLEPVRSASFRREPIPGALMAKDVDTESFVVI